MYTILLVCTGNTCRSSMAAAMFKKMVEDEPRLRGKVKILSAGTAAFPGQRASPQAIQVMEERGIDLRDHRATLLTSELIREADIILTMTERHKQQILRMDQQADGKVFTLKEYVQESDDQISGKSHDPRSFDIMDPFGYPVEVYRMCADEIEDASAQLTNKLIREVIPPETNR
jgi:protein-tyrosine-phosphatase